MITINRIEWVNPRWANKPEAWVIQKLVSTSISGRLLINAPHNIAFFPNLRPAKASPTTAPITVCVRLSIEIR